MKVNRVTSVIVILAIAVLMLGLLLVWATNINFKLDSKELAYNIDEDTIKVGFVMNSLYENRWAIEKEVFERRIEELGGTPLVKVGLYDSAVQKNHILEMMNQGAKVIVVVPQNRHDLKETLLYAYNEGVKIILYDDLVEGVYVDLFITPDYDSAGKMLEAQLTLFRDDRKKIYISGSNNSYKSQTVDGKFDYVRYQDRLEKAWAQNANVNEVIRNIENAKAQFEIGQIVVSTDECALALVDKGIVEDTKVYSIGGDLKVLEYIEAGKIAGSIYLPISEMATMAAEHAMSMVEGTFKQPENVTIISNGEFDITTIVLEVQYVGESNVDAFIEGRMEESKLTYEEVGYE